MGLLSKVKRLFVSGAEDLVDKLTDEERTLKYSVSKIHDEIYKAKDGLVAMMVNLKQIEKERDKLIAEMQTTKKKINVDNKDEALVLISNKQNYEAMIEQYNNSIKLQKKQIDNMKSNIRKAEARVKQAECAKNILLARKTIAEARKVIFHDIQMDDKVFDEMERKIDYKETFADVWEETTGTVVDDEKVLEEYEQIRQAKA